MRKYKITVGDRRFIVNAQDKVEAVRKLRDVKATKLGDEPLEEKERKAQEWVDYDIKHYGKVSETTKEDIRNMGLDFDKWDNQVEDSAIKDFGKTLDPILKKIDNNYDLKGWDSRGNELWLFDDDPSKLKKFANDVIKAIPKATIAMQPKENAFKNMYEGKYCMLIRDRAVKDSAIRDANKRTYLDRNEIAKIESEARSLRGHWISVYVGVDADKEGYFIDEMYINTTGTWLYKLSDIKEYMRELDNANKFMNKYEKFAENRRA